MVFVWRIHILGFIFTLSSEVGLSFMQLGRELGKAKTRIHTSLKRYLYINLTRNENCIDECCVYYS
jgi:hypothetical protein